MFGNHGAGGNGVLINQFLLKKKKKEKPQFVVLVTFWHRILLPRLISSY